MGEDCGGVYLILNLSEKGGLVYLTMKNTWLYYGLSEGRNRKWGRKGRKGSETEEVNGQQFLAKACSVWLLYMSQDGDGRGTWQLLCDLGSL